MTEHSHGGWGKAPVQTRSERFASTSHDAFPEVTGLEAEWKLSPVERVRALIDGELDGAPYAILYPESAGTTVEWIDRTSELIGTAGTPEERAAANAWSSFEKALHIHLDGDAETLTLTRTGLGDAPRAAHTVITAATGATGLVVLDNRGPAQLSENLEIVLDDDAHITVVSVQQWDDPALHLASQFARVGRGATLKHIVVSLGGSVVRVNPSAHLAGEGAEAELLGVYFADAGQHLEQRVYVHHEAPHTRSRVTYKGALNGDGARTVWVGDVLIGPGATGTDTYEQNRNLVLSDGTRADSIPNLEIETGDIEGAGHASATGRFDDEQLFYLQARGISEDEARRLVVLGFLSEIVQKIGEPVLEARLLAALEAELVASR
ncbi:Fe-S cluster assembly protein SufD [Protaetiibacter larvae]|uniref:Fe-S cluster assembly protein SufD n=1 Tax=Protaetiibacter larvae TaxID=2592654 RepID=A0A5C1YA57_9MICO|nr:Fe-S cluster assembly protein SufD [Protaetiibacter larvae]QEO10844.1 Fe-S cluster assembly protein SufD [Protaetiibacter larvae]